MNMKLDFTKVTLNIKKPTKRYPLFTYDGNETTEAEFGNKLVSYMNKRDYLFSYNIANKYAKFLNSRMYGDTVIGTKDAEGNPLEWNPSLWTFCGKISNAYNRFKKIKR